MHLPLNGQGFETASGRLSLWDPGCSILLAKIDGHGDAAFVRPVAEALGLALAGNQPVQLFFDVELLDTYDSKLRTELTSRFLRDLEAIRAVHVLARSKLVSMGVSVANLALHGKVRSHSERKTFTEAVDRALSEAGIVGFSSRVLEAARSMGV